MARFDISKGAQVIAGGKRFFNAGMAAFGELGTAKQVAGSRVINAALTSGRRGIVRGAMYGAGANMAWGAYNNMAAGGSPFDGMVGNAVRGGMYGGVAGFGLRAGMRLGGAKASHGVLSARAAGIRGF